MPTSWRGQAQSHRHRNRRQLRVGRDPHPDVMRFADGSATVASESGEPDPRGRSQCDVGSVRVGSDALPCLRTRVRRRQARTSPNAVPPGARSGRGLADLHPLRDAPCAGSARQFAGALQRPDTLPRAALRSADRSPVADQGPSSQSAYAAWIDPFRCSRTPAVDLAIVSNREASRQSMQAAGSGAVAGSGQYSLRMSTTLTKRSPAANRAMFSL